ncbi:hypothetical protein Taro_022016 [Colocasia esculenta]|uniref:Uncharacterized protein n=1 Tax=Colocasia esculenta TaxID=4460 RepID=A0A843VD81_COLES|nr:hypothetical protein [Colocasia esculenta]
MISAAELLEKYSDSLKVEEIQNLLNSEIEPVLPDYQEVATINRNGVVTISSVAEVSGFSTLEEGELPRETISGESGLVSLDPADPMVGTVPGEPEITPHDQLEGVTGHNPPMINTPSQGQEIEENPTIGKDSDGLGGLIIGDVPTVDGIIMNSPTPGVGTDVEASGVTCSTTDQTDGSTMIVEAVSHCDASIPSDSQETVPQETTLTEQAVPFPDDFPAHGVSWPDGPQPPTLVGTEAVLGIVIAAIRSTIQAPELPSVDVVRGLLERQTTTTYFSLGHPHDTWMEAIDCLWGEFRSLHAEAVWKAKSLQLQELRASILALEVKVHDRHLQSEAAHRRVEQLEVKESTCEGQILVVQRSIEGLLKTLDDLKTTKASHAQDIQQAKEEEACLIEEILCLKQEIGSKQSEVADLERQRPDHLRA